MACLRALAAASALAALAAASRPVSNVHLALSSDATRMHVQWTSAQGDVLGAGDSTVQWGASPRALTSSAAGFNWTWVDSSTQRKYTANEATMTGLAPGATYFYRVGSVLDGWSGVNSFEATRTAAQISEAAPLRIGWFGDLGWLYAQALPYLQTEAAQGNFDHVVHVGDYGELPIHRETTPQPWPAPLIPPTLTMSATHHGGHCDARAS